MFESFRRKLGLWLLPDGEEVAVRRADVAMLYDRYDRLSETAIRQNDIKRAAHYNLVAEDIEELIDDEFDAEEYGVTLRCGVCERESSYTYGSDLVFQGGCQECDDESGDN